MMFFSLFRPLWWFQVGVISERIRTMSKSCRTDDISIDSWRKTESLVIENWYSMFSSIERIDEIDRFQRFGSIRWSHHFSGSKSYSHANSQLIRMLFRAFTDKNTFSILSIIDYRLSIIYIHIKAIAMLFWGLALVYLMKVVGQFGVLCSLKAKLDLHRVRAGRVDQCPACPACPALSGMSWQTASIIDCMS